MESRTQASDTTLQTFVSSLVRWGIVALGLVAVLQQLGVQTTSILAVLGAASLAIGLAVQGALGNVAAGVLILIMKPYRIGDWVEINGVAGEVVEINLLRTVLLETGNWTDKGHPTGRKVAFVNSYAIEGHFFNFTTSGQWLWDELEITVPADQDPYPLLDSIQKTVAKETATSAHEAEEEWQNATTLYKVRSVSAEPAVNLRPTAAGVQIQVRYITKAHERAAIRTRLNQALVELLHHRGADDKESMSAAK